MFCSNDEEILKLSISRKYASANIERYIACAISQKVAWKLSVLDYFLHLVGRCAAAITLEQGHKKEYRRRKEKRERCFLKSIRFHDLELRDWDCIIIIMYTNTFWCQVPLLLVLLTYSNQRIKYDTRWSTLHCMLPIFIVFSSVFAQYLQKVLSV